jgi:predicted site-specific integrase-resolvase
MKMERSELEDEIGRLKARKMEIVNRMNRVTSFDEKEDMQNEVNRIQKQIETLENFK